MATRIVWNSRNVQTYLDGGNGVRELLMDRAERVAAAARANAPVDTGEYRDKIDVREDHTDRLALRVGSFARHAHLVEAQSGVMAKALDAAGG